VLLVLHVPERTSVVVGTRVLKPRSSSRRWLALDFMSLLVLPRMLEMSAAVSRSIFTRLVYALDSMPREFVTMPLG